MQTLVDKVAEAAFRAVEARRPAPEADRKEFEGYTSFALSFPDRIQQTGLCQAVTFAMAKSKDREGVEKAPGLVLQDVAEAATAVLAIPGDSAGARMDSLARAVRGGQNEPHSTYILQTRWMLCAATWIKRYTEAMAEELGQ